MTKISSLDPQFSVSNKTLDRQHLTILNLRSSALEFFYDDKVGDLKKFTKNLYELHSRILDHFYTEEDILLKHGYANLEEHILEHSSYTEKLSYLFFDVSNGVIDKPNMEFCLLDWVPSHLAEWDMEYGHFLQIH
jgi:hemerythrin-like metal-binding protein